MMSCDDVMVLVRRARHHPCPSAFFRPTRAPDIMGSAMMSWRKRPVKRGARDGDMRGHGDAVVSTADAAEMRVGALHRDGRLLSQSDQAIDLFQTQRMFSGFYKNT